MNSDLPERIRVDKWLWHARFFKTRGKAGEVTSSGNIRVNGERIAKSAHLIKIGDVLTFPKDEHIRVIQIEQISTRRGPAPEAQALYLDLEPPQRRTEQNRPTEQAARESGSGRPTKRERREIDAWHRQGP